MTQRADQAGVTGSPAADPSHTRQVLGGAVQDLAARRLGRAFLPLGAFLLVGLVDLIRSRGASATALVVVAGAPVSAAALLGWTQAMVRTAFGVPLPTWVKLLRPLAVLTWAYGLWAFAFLGIVPLVENAEALTPWALLEGLVFALLGGRFLVLVWRISEVQGLASVMALPIPEEPPRGRGS